MEYNEELGKEIPKGWRNCNHNELGDFKNGINFSKNENGDSSFYIINVRDIIKNNFVLESTCDVINIDFNKAKKYLLKEGDIILARSASPGEVIFIYEFNNKLIYSGFSIRFRSFNPIHRIYLFQNFQLIQNIIRYNLSDGTTLKNITQETLKQIQILIPDDVLLIRYNILIKNIHKKIVLLLKENRSLISIRDFLLPKLISGKIRV